MSDQGLITEVELQNINAPIEAAADASNKHILQPYQDVHRLWAQTGLSTFDNATIPAGQAPHRTGRAAIRVRCGGSSYLLPADPSPTGPPQPIRIALCPVVTFQGPIHGTFYLSCTQDGAIIYLQVEGGEEWPSSMTITTPVIGGTFPLDYEWQFSADSLAWLPLTTYRITGGCGLYPIGDTGAGNIPTPVGSFNGIFGIVAPGGDNSGGYFLRLKLTNAGMTQYGRVIRVYQQDAT
jgi:hypothetical protein